MKKKFIVFLAILGLLLGITGCERGFDKDRINGIGSQYGFVSPMFSPDNKKLIFGLCTVNNCDLATYEIQANKLSVFNPTGNKYNCNPSYSKDGKKIVFDSGPDHDINWNSDIYIMNADGSDVHQLTHDYNNNPIKEGDQIIIKYNVRPTFSPDGKKVLFKRAGVVRERSMGQGKMLSHWDIYEVNIETGIEKRLTNYKFYQMSRPYSLSDGKRFIFSGDGPQNNTGVGPKDFREYEEKYQDNKIFIMDGKNNLLRPMFMHGRYSAHPAVTKDDAILFLSITNEMDGLPRNPYNYDLFLKKGEKITRLTKMGANITPQDAISLDGSKVVFVAIKERKTGRTSLWMVNSDGTGLQKIELPWEQLEQTNIKPKNK